MISEFFISVNLWQMLELIFILISFCRLEDYFIMAFQVFLVFNFSPIVMVVASWQNLTIVSLLFGFDFLLFSGSLCIPVYW